MIYLITSVYNDPKEDEGYVKTIVGYVHGLKAAKAFIERRNAKLERKGAYNDLVTYSYQPLLNLKDAP